MRPGGLDPGARSDTIVALSSPAGRSPRAIVRLSGQDSWRLTGQLFEPLPERPGRIADGTLSLPGWPPAPGAALGFRGPRSFTGEDVVELWLPGAPPLVAASLAALTALGARPAGPGEFTQRAFLNGRLDLTQAEAVLALTSSADAASARAAARVLAGGISQRIDVAKAELVGVMAYLEAAIDFSEEDVELAEDAALAARLRGVQADLGGLLADSALPGGVEPVVVLWGPANAGKSSLANALSGSEAALVAAQAGTTRDFVEAAWTLPGGRGVRLLDLAGELGDSSGSSQADEIDRQAVARARGEASRADLVLCVLDPQRRAELESWLAACPEPRLVVLSKADLSPAPETPGALSVSARTGQGLAELAGAVAAALGGCAEGSELVGSARQATLLQQARTALERAEGILLGGDSARAELAAVDVGEALESLGALTGEVTSDDVLGEIFGRFCIGK